MGDNVSTMIEGGISGLSKSIFSDLIPSVMALLPQHIVNLIEMYKPLFLLAAICVLSLLALEGYKIFKMLVYVGGAFAFGYLGITYLAPAIASSVVPMLPSELNINFPGLVAVVCALVAVFLTRCAYTFMIMVIGGVGGYFLGSTVICNLLVGYFNTLDFLKGDMVKYIVGGVIAALLALISILLFKHIYMVATSFGGMVLSALLLQTIVMPTADNNVKICFIILGIAVGIYALVHQYKEEEKALEIVF